MREAKNLGSVDAKVRNLLSANHRNGLGGLRRLSSIRPGAFTADIHNDRFIVYAGQPDNYFERDDVERHVRFINVPNAWIEHFYKHSRRGNRAHFYRRDAQCCRYA